MKYINFERGYSELIGVMKNVKGSLSIREMILNGNVDFCKGKSIYNV